MCKFEKFLPPLFSLKPIDLEMLSHNTEKDWNFGSNGRSCLYNILKEYSIKTIMIPVYVCKSVLEPIHKLKLNVIYYDIDLEDLNPSLNSIKKNYTNKVDAILVPSMYGNPADLVNIEIFCKENDVVLIDDAAQSFGAKLDNRWIGTFGEAGFFSFSPGKPLSAHMGGFYFLNKKRSLKIKRPNFVLNRLIWFNFKYNRINIYKKNKVLGLVISLIVRLFERCNFIYQNELTDFDLKVMGGVLNGHYNGDFNFRQLYFDDFRRLLDLNVYCRVVSSIRGCANNHKIVIVVKDSEIASAFKIYLKVNRIFFINGYKLLKYDNCFENAMKVDGLVFELPIENDTDKMKYLKRIVKEFFNNYNISGIPLKVLNK